MTQQSENSRDSCAPTGRTLAHGRHGRPRPRPILQRLSTSCHVPHGSWRALCGSAVQDRCPGSEVEGHLSGAFLWSRSPWWRECPARRACRVLQGSLWPQLPSTAPRPATYSLQMEGSLWATPHRPPVTGRAGGCSSPDTHPSPRPVSSAPPTAQCARTPALLFASRKPSLITLPDYPA